jgi:beta-galactosidase
MPHLEVTQQKFNINGHPMFLHGGEIHYFRTDPAQWRNRLAIAKELGINVVSTYIPWLWHEPESGQFDFMGYTHPRRNLVDFLEIAHDLDLMVFVRPGPYVMSELKQEGLPNWLLRQHPEIIAEDNAGRPHPARMVSYLHPTFLTFVDRWYSEVSKVLTPYFAQQGGPIILTQLDNEVGMLHWVTAVPDQSRDLEGQYQSFRDQDAQYAAYGSNHYWGRAVFWRKYRAQYLTHLSEQGNRHAWPSPYVINVHGFRDYSIYSRGNCYPIGISQLLDAGKIPGAFLGGDFYPGRVGYDNFHDLALAVTFTATANNPEAPLFSPEFQSGRFQDRPHVDPSDLDLAARTSVSYGLNGLNWYMLSGGDNPDDIGLFGLRHEWQAPIASDGTLRPSSRVVRHLGSLFHTYGRTLVETTTIPDVYIGFYSAYYMTENPADTDQISLIDEIVSERDNWHFDGIYRILIAANLTVSAVMVDKEETTLDPRRIPLLWMATCRSMDARTQTRLADYVKEGGTLILGPRVPELDLNGRPCRILADSLDIPQAQTSGSHGIATILETTSVFCPYYSTFAVTAKTEVLGHVINGDATGAILTRHAVGTGTVVIVGCALPDLYEYYHNLVRQLCEALGCVPSLTVQNASIHATRREHASGGFLFIHNFTEIEQSTNVHLAPNDWHDALEWTLSLPPRTGLMLPYNDVEVGDAPISVIQTDAEITQQGPTLIIHRGGNAGLARLRNDPGWHVNIISPAEEVIVRQSDSQTTIQWRDSHHFDPIRLEYQLTQSAF